MHTGTEVVELVGIEATLVGDADAAQGLLPGSPSRGERVGTEPALVITCPTALMRVFGVVQSVGHHVEEARRVALHAPFVVRIFTA